MDTTSIETKTTTVTCEGQPVCVNLPTFCNLHGTWYKLTGALYKSPRDLEPSQFVGSYVAGGGGDSLRGDNLREKDKLYETSIQLPASDVAAAILKAAKKTSEPAEPAHNFSRRGNGS